MLENRIAELEAVQEQYRLALEDLSVHQEELRAQNETLMQAQSDLELSRRRFQILFAQAPMAYLVCDPTSLVLELNHKAADWISQDRYDANSIFLSLRMYDQESRQSLLAYLQHIVQGQHPPAPEVNLLTSGGTSLTVEIHGTLDETPATPRILLALIDVSHRVRQRQDQARLQLQAQALQAVANAISIVSPAGFIQWVNPAFTELTGYAPEEAIGHTPAELLCSGLQDQAFYADLWKTIRNDRVWRGELVNRRKDGSHYHEELSITPVRNDAGELHYFIAIRQDISARRQAQLNLERSRQELEHYRTHLEHLVAERSAELLEANARFRMILDTAANGLMGVDEAFRVTFINPAGCVLLGYRAEQLLGRNVHQLLQLATAEQARYENNTASLLADVFEGRALREDDTLFVDGRGHQSYLTLVAQPMMAEGRVKGAIISFFDVSARVVADLARERALAVRRAAEEQLRLLLEFSADGVYGTDDLGRVTFVNPAACRMLGYTAKELLGQSMHEVIHDRRSDGSVYAESECPIGVTLRCGEPVRIEDEVFWRRDGVALPVTYATQPILKDGRILGVVVNFQDATAQRELREAREQALADAERLARLRSEFLASMSHEIRNPLNGILGMAQIGYRDSVEGTKLREGFRHILTAGHFLMGILNDLLDFSKIEAGELVVESVPVDLVALCHEQIVLFQERAAARRVKLRLELEENLPGYCLSDPLRLRQILTNLLSNAIKFTEQGTVTLAVSKQEPLILEWRVSDTGIGMAIEHQHRLFTPFHQADASIARHFGGTGLGLAITHRLVQLLGGRIEVSSLLGVGSEFRVQIPLEVIPEAPITAPEDAVPNPACLVGLRILVAEDNLINQCVMEDNLLSEGAEVSVVDDGLQAVQRIERLGTKAFDLVLMDVMMPVMDGYTATRRIREYAPELPIIGQTAHALASERDQCLAAGMTDVVTKPIDFLKLFQLIRRVLPPASG